MKAVDRGAALLDERLPGWRHAVNARTLDLKRPCNCVLGQIFGEYAKGTDVLGIDRPEDFGFDKPPRTSWEKLTEAWRKVIG